MDRISQVEKKAAEKRAAAHEEVQPVYRPSNTAQRPMATIQDDDERLLARIGYRQELRREFTKWSTVSYAISILGVLGSQPATYGVPLSLGGPATAVWAWFIGSIMAYVIASSGQIYVCTVRRLCADYVQWRSWSRHIQPQAACTLSRSMWCLPNMLQSGLGSLGGATFWDKRLVWPRLHTQLGR